MLTNKLTALVLMSCTVLMSTAFAETHVDVMPYIEFVEEADEPVPAPEPAKASTGASEVPVAAEPVIVEEPSTELVVPDDVQETGYSTGTVVAFGAVALTATVTAGLALFKPKLLKSIFKSVKKWFCGPGRVFGHRNRDAELRSVQAVDRAVNNVYSGVRVGSSPVQLRTSPLRVARAQQGQ